MESSTRGAASANPSPRRFRVAFSFAGEKRDYVGRVAADLAARFGEAAVLYHWFHEAEFGRRDLAFYLPDLYREQSDLIVVVVCPNYQDRSWCGLEWDAIFDLHKSRENHRVMLCRFDQATLRGLHSTAGFVDLDDNTPEQAAALILQRLAINEGKPKHHYLDATGTHASQAQAGEIPRSFQSSASRLFRGRNTGSDLLVGREQELADLDAAWHGEDRKNIVTIVAWGGVGKTSLVSHWANGQLARPDRGGIERYFDWSFYSQGARSDGDATGADKAASADIFLKDALEFFGDPGLASSNASAWQKGERLAQLVGEHRTLLILDGLEPLQDAQTGELRDDGLRSLLRGLAVAHRGLCLITTRQHLPELDRYRRTAPEWELRRLSKSTGAMLLERLGVRGTLTEREQLADDVKGHALTLTLLGKYLAEAHDGDIRKRDQVSLTDADHEETRGHAFRVMEAYERWLEHGGRGVELAILRLLGLFDRPATPDCLAALRTAAIPALTDILAPVQDAEWNLAVKRLFQLGLVEEQPWEPRRIVGYSEEEANQSLIVPLGEPQPFNRPRPGIRNGKSLDAHPLIREFFGARLRETAERAWRAGHSCLFEHLRSSVPFWPEGLDGLQPLYQAVSHGCRAGRNQETCEKVLYKRIIRMTRSYSMNQLGAISADLAAVGCFFVTPWTQLAPDLPAAHQGWLLNSAAFALRALGRLTEARDPLRRGLELVVQREDWRNAAVGAANLSELDVMLGEVESAVREAEQSVDFAQRSGDYVPQIIGGVTLADALHQSGQVVEARRRFQQAEALQAKREPHNPRLYSLRAFQFCDLLLASAERAAWFEWLSRRGPIGSDSAKPTSIRTAVAIDPEAALSYCHTVEKRATSSLAVSTRNRWLMDIADDNLILGRAMHCRTILTDLNQGRAEPEWTRHLDAAIQGLRQAGTMHHLPRALIARAWLRVTVGNKEHARADLDEAQSLAERGPMPLHLADVHLHRARLFRDKAELEKAAALIEKHGYGRRRAELEDARAAAQSW